jgi:PPOX class probable F420-dependent enzyme
MIEDAIKSLATDKNFAVLTTLLPSGYAQSQVMWVDADDEHILINTEVHRQKFKDVERDPRVTVTILEEGNPYHYAEVRGRVTEIVRGDEARAHIDRLSEKYTGHAYQPQIQSERVLLKITPERQRVQ